MITLASEILDSFDFKSYFLETVGSTSQFLKEKIKQESTSKLFCSSIEQTDGYGQRSRSWLSNKNSLKFSIAFELNEDMDSLFLSGLQLALFFRKILSNYHAEELKVKWPNDIYSSKGKICGILTEIVKTEKNYVVIGVGINVDYCLLGTDFNSDSVSWLKIEDMLKEFLINIDSIYENNKISKLDVLDEWSRFDFFEEDCEVLVLDGLSSNIGLYRGLSMNCMPKILFNDKLVEYISANVSLKKVES